MSALVLKNVAVTRRAAVMAIARHSSMVSDNDPHVLETEKQRNLLKIQHKTSTPHEHAPGWNEYLATASEAIVKADKSIGSISDFQRMTVEHINARHSGNEAHEAVYTHDSVVGPLSNAPGVEDTPADNHHEKVKKTKDVRKKVAEETREGDEGTV